MNPPLEVSLAFLLLSFRIAVSGVDDGENRSPIDCRRKSQIHRSLGHMVGIVIPVPSHHQMPSWLVGCVFAGKNPAHIGPLKAVIAADAGIHLSFLWPP